jgi:transcriptional regulator with XRE-family HTH domain
MATGAALFHTDTDRVRMRNEIRRQIVNKLSDKEYRDIFVSEQINTGLAFQIKAMREARGWTQAELGDKAGGMAQSRISIMEDANYSRFSLNTLKRLASAFDVALIVRFEPFSKLVEHFVTLDSSALSISSFNEDQFYEETSFSENLEIWSTNTKMVGAFAATEETIQYVNTAAHMAAGWQEIKPWMHFITVETYDPAATPQFVYPLTEKPQPYFVLSEIH